MSAEVWTHTYYEAACLACDWRWPEPTGGEPCDKVELAEAAAREHDEEVHGDERG